MYKLLAGLVLGLASWGQITSIPNAGGGSSYSTGYNASVSAQTTLTVTAATHGQGVAPIAACFDNATPAVATACAYTRSSAGEIVFTWSPAFTGTVSIWAGGGTSGISGASSLTTAGAIPYVASAGVLTQAPTGLFYDSANVRLGVGTGSPNFTLTVASAGASGQAQITGTSASAYGGFNLANNIGYVLQIGTYGTANANANEAFMYAATGVSALRIWTADSTTPIKFIPGNTERARFAATTGNLLLGTTTDDTVSKLQVAGSIAATTASDTFVNLTGGSGNYVGIYLLGGTSTYTIERSSSSKFIMSRYGVGSFLTAHPTRNITISSDTDGNYKLDIAASGSSGTLRVFNQTAGGSTLAVIQAGDTQSGNLLSIRNNAGTEKVGVDVNGTLTAVTLSGDYAGNLIRFGGGGGRSQITSPTNGNIILQNNAATDFDRLQFGGTTSGFPSIARSGAELYFKLADDSAGAVIRAGGYKSSDGTAGVTVTTCTGFKNGLCISGT